MAYQGRKVFVAGTVLTASDMNSTVDQTVMVFEDAAARTTAIPTPTEGMLTYLEDTDAFEYWDGSDWEEVGAGVINASAVVTSTSDKSANYTLVAGDKNTFIRSTGSAITITVPDVLVDGESVNFIQDGAGQITFAGDSITINSKEAKLKTKEQFSAATVAKVGGAYYLVGDLD